MPVVPSSSARLMPAVILILCPGLVFAQGERSEYISDASYLVGTWEPGQREHTPESMAAAGQAFLDSLTAEQRQQVNLPIDDPERRQWTNLPPRPDAGGIRLGLLDETQLRAACNLLAELLSERGYHKMRDIMLADDQLVRPGRPGPGFGTEHFSLVLFGTPSASEPWGVQLDGHHIGLNVSLTGDALTLSPSFIGTQPESFELGSRSIRPLTGEIDGAFELVARLSDDQRREAILRPRRGQILTGPGKDNRVPEVAGVSGSTFSDDQKELLLKLIGYWIGDLPPEHADQRMAEIEAEIDQIHFAWNGAIEPGSDISYRIQGPSLIIEYACQDMGGNPQDHLHTMYRDPTNEYGGQIPAAR